jgi:hypothetical protein
MSECHPPAQLARLLLLVSLSTAWSCAATTTNSVAPGRRQDISVLPNSLHILAGVRGLDEDDWGPVDRQGALAVEYARQGVNSAVGFELGLQLSGDTDESGGTDLQAGEAEVYGGIRANFLRAETVQPYVGAGLTALTATVEIDNGSNVDDDDGSLGLYVHGGITVCPSGVFHVGADLRAVFATDLELFGASTDGDYLQLAIFAGWAF